MAVPGCVPAISCRCLGVRTTSVQATSRYLHALRPASFPKHAFGVCARLCKSRPRDQFERIFEPTGPARASNYSGGTLDTTATYRSQDDQTGNVHPVRTLLSSAVTLFLLRKVIDGKGILLAGSWLLCQIAPWTVSLLTAAAVAHVWFNRPSLSIVALVMTPICSIIAAIPGGLPSMIPAQHLVALTVRYPYFHGSVAIARVCARWIQQQQSLCAFLNAALAWGPWVLVSLAGFLLCAVQLERVLGSRPILDTANTANAAASIKTVPTAVTEIVVASNGASADTSCSVRQEQDIQKALSRSTGSLLQQSVPAEVYNQASLGNRNAIAESKFHKSESQIASAQFDNCVEIPSCYADSQAVHTDLAPASEPDCEPCATRDADLQEQDIQQTPHDQNPIADPVPVKMLDRNAEQKHMLLELFDMVLSNEVVRERDVALDRVQQLEQELQTLKAAAEAQSQADRAQNHSTLDLQQLAMQVEQLQVDAQQLGGELQNHVASQTSKEAPALDQSGPSLQSTDTQKEEAQAASLRPKQATFSCSIADSNSATALKASQSAAPMSNEARPPVSSSTATVANGHMADNNSEINITVDFADEVHTGADWVCLQQPGDTNIANTDGHDQLLECTAGDGPVRVLVHKKLLQ